MDNFVTPTPAEIDQLLEQIYAGFDSVPDDKQVSFIVKTIFSLNSVLSDSRVYPATITFRNRSKGLSYQNDLNAFRLGKVLNDLVESNPQWGVRYLLFPAYQSDYTLHYHGIFIYNSNTRPDCVGLSMQKKIKATLNNKIGFCKIENLRTDSKAKIYSPTDALTSVIKYALSEDNYAGIVGEYTPLTNIDKFK